MFVKYKGEKYKCKFKNKFTITIIKIKLRFKRCIRLFKVIFTKSDLLLYLMIICLWFIFAGFSNLIECRRYQVQKSYLSALWNLRNSMFSSVILAFAIGSFNHLKEYRKIIKSQHYTYVDTMNDFEEIIKTVDNAQIWQMFNPMYNEHCFRKSIEYLRNENININGRDFLISIDIVQDRIKMVEQELKAGNLLIQDEVMMNCCLSFAKKRISKVVLNEDRNEFEKLLNDLFQIVNQLRYLWRKDEKNDSQIISILDKEDINNINNDIYKKMFLPNFELSSLEE